MDHKYVVAVDYLRGKTMHAAAVVYPGATREPSFTYKAGNRTVVSHLYRRGDRVPTSIDSALSGHVRDTALSWSVVSAHPDADLDKVLTLAIVRAMELWFCRASTLPSLAETCVVLPVKRKLNELPSSLAQFPSVKDWRVGAARALCRHKNATEQSERI